MIYLEITYSNGLVFRELKDAMMFAEAVSKAVQVAREGYGDNCKFNETTDALVSKMESIKPSQLILESDKVLDAIIKEDENNS